MIREMMRGVDTFEEAKDKVQSESEDNEAAEEKKRQIEE